MVTSRQRTAHLIGRDDAIESLLGALAEVRGSSAGRLTLVSGEVGIGKTRLLEEFAARAGDALVARGGCVEGVPYAPWTDSLWWLLHAHRGTDVGDLPEAARSQLARLLPGLGAAASGTSDREAGQHLLFEAVVELLANAAARGALVLVVDDLHWIDPASRELLLYVAANLPRLPILLVAEYRPEDVSSQRDLVAQLGRVAQQRIDLTRLGPVQATEMAAQLLGTDAQPADVERIARDAEGNPLFVEELVAAQDASGIPPTVRDLMLVRFGFLDDDARHLVRVAALIGTRSPRAWLAGASHLDTQRVRDSARSAVDVGVLVPSDDGSAYEFRHALLRQAVMDHTLPDERVELDHAIAETLTRHPEFGVGVDRVAELAYHWDASGVPAAALHWCVAAGRHAQESYAFEAALAAYERALFWADAVPDVSGVAEIDHAALLLEAADAAGYAGHIDRAADLARAGLDEACALDISRGVEAAGRVYPLFWAADRAPELYEFATSTLVPVLDEVDADVRARFLVSQVEHLVGSATSDQLRAPAEQMMAAVQDVADPVIKARAHMVNAWCFEAYGDFDEVEAEYEHAADVARCAGAHSTLALVLYNHAGFKPSIPDLAGCLRLLDAVDDLVERFALRRYHIQARRLRALALCLQGDLTGAIRAIASLDDLVVQGVDAWTLASGRALIGIAAGDYDAALAALEPEAVGVGVPHDSELVIELAMLRADARAWKSDIDGARREVDTGEAAVADHRETYHHGWLAMVGARVEADAAVAASTARSLGAIERAETRAASILTAWQSATSELPGGTPLRDAYSRAIAAEMARARSEEAAACAGEAADAFDAISLPYYASYFRWREAQALLREGRRPAATEILKRARAVAHSHGFEGLVAVISALARENQLRLGPARTTVDGDEALSERELEVLRLMVDGMSNPEIAQQLYISRRTAAAHVSSIMRKLDASSRVEAVSEAYRRQVV